MTQVVNIKNTVYIGRAGYGESGYFGNPFVISKDINREKVLELYRAYFYERLKSEYNFKIRIEALRGKILMCFCKPLLCHGDIIVEYLDKLNLDAYRGEIG